MADQNYNMWSSTFHYTPMRPMIPAYDARFGIPFPPPTLPFTQNRDTAKTTQQNWIQSPYQHSKYEPNVIINEFPPLPDDIDEEYVRKNLCTVLEKPKDEISQWIENWSANKINKEYPQNNDKSINDVKINDISLKIKKCKVLFKNMSNIKQKLEANVSTMTKNEWERDCSIWKSNKDQLDAIINTLKLDKYDISVLKYKLKKRKKKRNRLKNSKKHLKVLKLQLKDETENLNAQIESWQNAIKDNILKLKLIEETKFETSAVLKCVKGKIDDAKNQLSLFDNLDKLRKFRLQNCANQRKNIRLEEILNKLKLIWQEKLTLYQNEELELKEMLDKSKIQKNLIKEIEDQEKINDWNKVLFGLDIKSEVIFNSPELFFKIRQDWDKYIIPENSTQTRNSSCIPIGWIVPSSPTNLSWAAHLEKTDLK
ncbi:programmed cell death protein 7-like [Daktulosphaira vitifoliae]|uniref:programmed cell death protein 7-like n=1 Tax=Daktulosphaira vitifoliae TaxID=58002 RepID=UPI0021AA5CCF|nr:programmed cell death protein 7-like [Daktulosphaira vitifoliae]